MTTYTRDANSGTGPGAITPDGCAVEMYARLPDMGESAVVASAVAAPRGLRLLELGAGAGRMTGPLVRSGFRVTAVDESRGMLDRIEDAELVHAPVEGLDLGRRFDVVTLASFLVDAPDPALRAGLLATCARHVAADGCVVVQRQHAARQPDGPPGSGRRVGGGMTLTTTAVEDLGDGVVRHEVHYLFEDPAAGRRMEWTQTYYARRMSEPEFAGALAEAGLALDRWLTDRHDWARAVPAR